MSVRWMWGRVHNEEFWFDRNESIAVDVLASSSHGFMKIYHGSRFLVLVIVRE